MATTKTLTPTNQEITISAFTEKPDNRINANNDDKLADAVNTLNSNLANKATTKANVTTVSKNSNVTLPYSDFGTFVNGHTYIVTIIGDNPSWAYTGILYFSGSRTKIIKLDNSYINVSVDASQFTISNTHAEYDQRVVVEVIGRY